MDTHTGLHIVNCCLSGPLAQDRTIILVTHHVSLCLPAASYLVELSKGETLRQGSIHEFEDLGQLDEIVEAEDEPLGSPVSAKGPENEAGGTVKLFEEKKDIKGKLVEIEARAEGRISWRTYLTYIQAAGIISWMLTVLLLLLIRAIDIGNQVITASQMDRRSLIVARSSFYLGGVLPTTNHTCHTGLQL